MGYTKVKVIVHLSTDEGYDVKLPFIDATFTVDAQGSLEVFQDGRTAGYFPANSWRYITTEDSEPTASS